MPARRALKRRIGTMRRQRPPRPGWV